MNNQPANRLFWVIIGQLRLGGFLVKGVPSAHEDGVESGHHDLAVELRSLTIQSASPFGPAKYTSGQNATE